MPEHQSIEWKKNWQDEYLKWICGYANAYGGTLFIGKDDNGNVTGIMVLCKACDKYLELLYSNENVNSIIINERIKK